MQYNIFKVVLRTVFIGQEGHLALFRPSESIASSTNPLSFNYMYTRKSTTPGAGPILTIGL